MRTACTIVIISVATLGALVLAHTWATSSADETSGYWLDELDSIAKEFSGEEVIEGRTIPLEGPRRMIFYTPQKTEVSRVFSGACYALHLGGNPEVIIAIENSGDEADPSTYIEISRLSGAAINVYRKGEKVAEFPARGRVEGAYVGLAK